MIAVSPSIGYPGATVNLIITGGNTNFGTGSKLSFSGTGITVNSVTAISATKLQANITIAAGAAVGPYDATVVTTLGPGVTEITNGSHQFSVGTSTTPLLGSILPNQVAVGTTTVIDVSGVATHFDTTSKLVMDSSDIAVGTVTVLSPTHLKAEITVDASTRLGFHTFLVQTGSELVDYPPKLLIVDSLGIPAALPSLTAVTPSSGPAGATALDISVTGSNTHFIDGQTIASFSGSGIDVVSTKVTSPTQATVRVNISATASLGFRDLLLLTNGETAVAVSGFDVLPPVTPPPPTATIANVIPGTVRISPFTQWILIKGSGTHFSKKSILSFSGNGISVITTHALNSEWLTAGIRVQASAKQGKRDVTVTTGTEVATGKGKLDVEKSWWFFW